MTSSAQQCARKCGPRELRCRRELGLWEPAGSGLYGEIEGLARQSPARPKDRAAWGPAGSPCHKLSH